jgi:hypothetical protein
MSRITPRALILLAVGLAGLLASGCTKPYLVVNTPVPSQPPPPDKARIYFVKPGGSMGTANTYILLEDKVVGYLENRKVFYLELPPGEHFFMSVTSNAEGLRTNLAGGKTYYVRIFSHPGAMSLLVGGSEDMRLEPIVPGGEQWPMRHEWILGNQLITVNEEVARKWEARYADRNAERLHKFKSGEAEFKTLSPEQGE